MNLNFKKRDGRKKERRKKKARKEGREERNQKSQMNAISLSNELADVCEYENSPLISCLQNVLHLT